MTDKHFNRLSPLELMRELISFPTISRDSNLPLIDWVEKYLNSHGISALRWPDPDQPVQQQAALSAGMWVLMSKGRLFCLQTYCNVCTD